MRCDPPGDEDVTTLVAAMVERVRASLCRRGLLDADDGEEPSPDAQLLLQCAAADLESVTRTVQKARPGKGRRKPKPLCAAYGGMELHAATTVPAKSTDAPSASLPASAGFSDVRPSAATASACSTTVASPSP